MPFAKFVAWAWLQIPQIRSIRYRDFENSRVSAAFSMPRWL